MNKIKRKNKQDKGIASHSRAKTWLIGVDEVGRGPLAGPVGVCAVAIPYKNTKQKSYAYLQSLLRKKVSCTYPKHIDSKKMSQKDREFWFDAIYALLKEKSIYSTYATASAQRIDEDGISVCIQRLVDTCVRKTISDIYKNSTGNITLKTSHKEIVIRYIVLLDGGLKTTCAVDSSKTIIKGDQKEIVISLASVFAKVSRDTEMMRMSRDKKYKDYGFDEHKGYGTEHHRKMIQIYGMSDIHRKTFCTKIKR